MTVVAAAIGSFVASLAATSVAADGVAYSGVLPDLPGGTVLSVSSTGFAWRDGIRPGQVVIRLDPADSPNGWYLETSAGGRTFQSRAAPMDDALRSTLPLGILAIGLAGSGLLFLRTQRAWALSASALALQGAAVPAWVAGYPETSTWIMAAAALVPGMWLGASAPLGKVGRAGAIALIAAAVALWAIVRLTGAPGVEALDAGGLLLGVGGSAMIVARQAVRARAYRLEPPRSHPFRLSDGFAVALVAAAALTLMFALSVPPLFAGVTVALLALALPQVRHRLVPRIRDFVFEDIRRQERADAVEDERARLARELHDVPLQRLVALARRLELIPQVSQETAEVQMVVEHLRDVATNLRPPVLDDLGLGAGLEYLADTFETDAVPISLALVNLAGIEPASRPPENVELAVYRIAREAIVNATSHAAATRIEINARVTQVEIDIHIADNGAGISPGRLRAALSQGHMGVPSMRRRAQAIGAELFIRNLQHGTEVRLLWGAQ
jgi:signal transduction histidine kinase